MSHTFSGGRKTCDQAKVDALTEMKPTGATSLTGHVGSNEQNEPSTSRGLHTPFKSVNYSDSDSDD